MNTEDFDTLSGVELHNTETKGSGFSMGDQVLKMQIHVQKEVACLAFICVYIYREREKFFFNQVPLTFIPHVSFPNKQCWGRTWDGALHVRQNRLGCRRPKVRPRGSEEVFGGRWEGSRRRASGLHVL